VAFGDNRRTPFPGDRPRLTLSGRARIVVFPPQQADGVWNWALELPTRRCRDDRLQPGAAPTTSKALRRFPPHLFRTSWPLPWFPCRRAPGNPREVFADPGELGNVRAVQREILVKRRLLLVVPEQYGESPRRFSIRWRASITRWYSRAWHAGGPTGWSHCKWRTSEPRNRHPKKNAAGHLRSARDRPTHRRAAASTTASLPGADGWRVVPGAAASTSTAAHAAITCGPASSRRRQNEWPMTRNAKERSSRRSNRSQQGNAFALASPP